MSNQAAFLDRVRRALGHQAVAGRAPEASGRESAAIAQEAKALRDRLQARRTELISHLQEQLTAVGGVVRCVRTIAEATAYVRELALEKNAHMVVRWSSELFRELEVDAALQEHGVEVQVVTPSGEVSPQASSEAGLDQARQAMREALARADIGLSAVDCAIAETGTLALSAAPGQMRGVSLLPPVHVAIVRSNQIVESLADYLLLLRSTSSDLQAHLTSCISFITGPSRTGDIELTLTVGVHGPGELHLIVLDDA